MQVSIPFSFSEITKETQENICQRKDVKPGVFKNRLHMKKIHVSR
jgi:hypothetical protein